MMKHIVKNRNNSANTSPDTKPRTLTLHDVVLSRDEWRKNPAFSQLLRQHLLQYSHLPVEKLASSIIGHWTRKYGGTFLEIVAGEGLQPFNIKQEMERVSTIVVNIANRILTPRTARNEVHSTVVEQSSDDSRILLSSDSSFEDSDGSNCDASELLPSIPNDIFDQPVSPGHSPAQCASPRLGSLLTNNAPQASGEIVEESNLPAAKAIDLVKKKKLSTDCQSKLKEKRENDSNKALPPRKRFKSYNTHPISTTPTLSKKSNGNYTRSDVIFAGPVARDHKGNLLLSHWIKRFSKTPWTCQDAARQIFLLWSELGSRFLEPKTSDLDGTTVWVELDSKVVVERLAMLTRAMSTMQAKGDKKNTKLDGLPEAGVTKLYKVALLDVDVEASTIRPGRNFTNIQSSEPIVLTTSDVIFGTTSHAGNLRFVHHIDDYLPRFERCTTLGGSLDLVRKMLTVWKQRTRGKGRFAAPNATDSLSFSFVDDELSVLLGVVCMIKALLHPIATTDNNDVVYLGDFWTCQRTVKRNVAYHNKCMDAMKSFCSASQDEDLVRRSSMEDSVAKAIVDGMLNDRRKTHFSVFDGQSRTWKKLSAEEAVQRTRVLMLLKACFNDDLPAKFELIDSKAVSSADKSMFQVESHKVDLSMRPPITAKTPELVRGDSPASKLMTETTSSQITPDERFRTHCPIPTSLISRKSSLVVSPIRSSSMKKGLVVAPQTHSTTDATKALISDPIAVLSPGMSPTNFINQLHPCPDQKSPHYMQPIARRPALPNPGMFHYQPVPMQAPSGVFPKLRHQQIGPIFHPSMALREAMHSAMQYGIHHGVHPNANLYMHNGMNQNEQRRQEDDRYRTTVWVPMSVPCKHPPNRDEP